MHVSIVGAGLGGLTTAALLRQQGAAVTLYDHAAPGGLARSATHAGATVNLGPHALYRGSAALPVLRRLGITPKGGVAPAEGKVLRGGALHALPGGPGSFLASTALTTGEKLRIPAWMAMPPKGGTVEEWLAPAPDGVRDLLAGLVRVATYANAPEVFAAASAFAQVRRALAGVLYLDGGWQQLVDALIPLAGPIVREDVTDLGGLSAGPVVLAGPPALARRFGVSVPEMTGARVACLDLVLERLPRPESRFVLGLDAPLYLSEHGSIAALGGTVVHVARYLAPGDGGAAALPELEALMDQAQPGWRSLERWRRFAPTLTASHRVDRVGETVSGEVEIGGRIVHLVGDWVGEGAMLADRSFASAARAADALLASARMAA